MASAARDVFINCPFDDDYAPGFRALVFAVLACGFRARCAREMDDGTETRIDKLYRIIEQSRFGVHDLSRTELDKDHGLPRFNMPLELGIFLGAKRFGDGSHKQKRCLIIDTEQYRFQKFISDLAGMDVTPHRGDPRRMVECTRNWLVTASRRRSIPSNAVILDSFDRFAHGLPKIAQEAGLDGTALVFADFERLVLAWVKADHGRI
jgi:hypothetical protein